MRTLKYLMLLVACFCVGIVTCVAIEVAGLPTSAGFCLSLIISLAMCFVFLRQEKPQLDELDFEELSPEEETAHRRKMDLRLKQRDVSNGF